MQAFLHIILFLLNLHLELIISVLELGLFISAELILFVSITIAALLLA